LGSLRQASVASSRYVRFKLNCRVVTALRAEVRTRRDETVEEVIADCGGDAHAAVGELLAIIRRRRRSGDGVSNGTSATVAR
jgi:hypothetical protein